MSKNRKKSSLSRIVRRMVLALLGFALVITLLLRGNNIALFNSKGTIAHDQRSLMVATVAILMLIAIPALFLFFFTAWKYRESNTHAKHDPDSHHGKLLVPFIWLAPASIAAVLAVMLWPAAHKLDPKVAIAADAKPITIQVVAMRWKWLFIYPEQHIASVNFVQIPVHTPVAFELTADEAPMSSFWIPNLGGQLYAMTGHENKINLMGNIPGDYTGSSAEINGAGFADMKFTTRVSAQDAFDAWVSQVKQKGNILDIVSYQQLVQPSQNNPASSYSVTQDDLYDTVLMKYMGPGMNMDMGMQ